MRQALSLSAVETAEVLSSWRRRDLEGCFPEISEWSLCVIDLRTGTPLLDRLVDEAAQKETGGWSSRVPHARGDESASRRSTSALRRRFSPPNTKTTERVRRLVPSGAHGDSEPGPIDWMSGCRRVCRERFALRRRFSPPGRRESRTSSKTDSILSVRGFGTWALDWKSGCRRASRERFALRRRFSPPNTKTTEQVLRHSRFRMPRGSNLGPSTG